MRWERLYRADGSKRVRYYFVINDKDVAFTERNGANPKLWDVIVHTPSFGTVAYSLREAKEIIEARVSTPKRSTP